MHDSRESSVQVAVRLTLGGRASIHGLCDVLNDGHPFKFGGNIVRVLSTMHYVMLVVFVLRLGTSDDDKSDEGKIRVSHDGNLLIRMFLWSEFYFK